MAYTGAPIFISDLLLNTDHSLIDQSLNSRMGEHTTNGDGFGIAWYDQRDTPGVYKHIQPAWNDLNLQDLAHQVQSHHFVAHIRAATGTAVQWTNCHPFRSGEWVFVHNGLIEGFSKLRRRMALEVDPQLYNEIQGTTDSELLFYLALTFGARDDPAGGLQRMAGFIEAIAREHDVTHPLQMSACLTNGQQLHAVRYSSVGRSRTLHVSTGPRALQRTVGGPQQSCLLDCTAVVSEPITDLEGGWELIDESTLITLEEGRIERRPFQPAAP